MVVLEFGECFWSGLRLALVHLERKIAMWTISILGVLMALLVSDSFADYDRVVHMRSLLQRLVNRRVSK